MYYYYDHFLPLFVRGTRQQPRQQLLLRPKSCTNISNTHFTVNGIFCNNNIMHTLSPSDLPPLSHGQCHVKTRGEGGRGKTRHNRGRITLTTSCEDKRGGRKGRQDVTGAVSHGQRHVKSRGEGGEGRTDVTGAVGGGGRGSSSSSGSCCQSSAQKW